VTPPALRIGALWQGDCDEGADQGIDGGWSVALGVRSRPGLGGWIQDCTKLDKASWKPASEAEAKAKSLGYEVRRSKIEGSCYEVYGVKEGKLFELFYSPEDLSLKKTIAK
jgi:hypothetical protein